MPRKNQVPLIRQGVIIADRWFCITKYKERKNGIIEAVHKFDVTDQIEEIIKQSKLPKAEPAMLQCPQCECLWREDELLKDSYCPAGCDQQINYHLDKVTE